MADGHRQNMQVSEPRDEEEHELEELELEVNQMAQKILHFRRTIPDQFKNNLQSLLVAMRPDLPQIEIEVAEIERNRCLEVREQAENGSLLAKEDPETANKANLLKTRISANASALPVLLKRMNACIARMDKLNQSRGNPVSTAFKRKRTH